MKRTGGIVPHGTGFYLEKLILYLNGGDTWWWGEARDATNSIAQDWSHNKDLAQGSTVLLLQNPDNIFPLGLSISIHHLDTIVDNNI